MGSNQYWGGRVYDLFVYLMTGTPEGSTKSGFSIKPHICIDIYIPGPECFVKNFVKAAFQYN